MTSKSVTWLSVVLNVLLAAAKVAAGIIFASRAIMADGVHSLSDLITDVAVLFGLRITSKPADRTHPYGHRRVSTMIAMFVGAGLFGAAAIIAYNAVEGIDHFDPSSPHKSAIIPFIVAIVTVPIKEFLYQKTVRTGKREKDASLIANAWHHRSDAVTSLAAALGLGGVVFGGPKWGILDPVTALGLSMILGVVAVRIILQSANELIDSAPDEKTLEKLEMLVCRMPEIKGFHAMRARTIGGQVEMDLHIQVDGDLTVTRSHEIATDLKKRIIEKNGDVLEVIVHVEPEEYRKG